MADFCHDFDPGGLGCGSDCSGAGRCFGDFTYCLSEAYELEPGWEFQAGLCEGHGTGVYFTRDSDGTLWFEHGSHLGQILELRPAHIPARVRVEEP